MPLRIQRGLALTEFGATYDFFQSEQRAINSQPTDHATKGANNCCTDTWKDRSDCCPHGRAAQDSNGLGRRHFRQRFCRRLEHPFAGNLCRSHCDKSNGPHLFKCIRRRIFLH